MTKHNNMTSASIDPLTLADLRAVIKKIRNGPLSAADLGTYGIRAQQLSSMVPSPQEPLEPLEETWSPEKIEAWRVINVTVKKGDPDGLWLGFPHPDGPTENVVTSVRHPIGVELHAECKSGLFLGCQNCHTVPGEQCASTYGDGCGFYAFKTHAQAVEHARSLQYAPCPRSVARVLLSGKVIEHEEGYRAEILEVIEVEAPSDTATVFAPPGPVSDALMAFWLSSSTTFSDLYKGGQ